MKAFRCAGLSLAAALAVSAAISGQASAQASGANPADAYPNQMVRIVVPFSAGSATDILARTIAEKLVERWGQQVIVENRPGAPGTASVARAPADGHTVMLTSNGHTVMGLLNKNLPFDPAADFAGVIQVASVPLALIIYPALPAKTLKEFIELAKQRPGEFNYGSAGLGSTTFIAGTLLKHVAKIDMQHVPYRGAPEAMTSVVRGDSHVYFNPASVGVQMMQTGQVRGLAVTTQARLPQLPDVPTFAEAGLSEFRYDSWFGIMAPVGVPRPIIEKISRDIGQILQTPELQGKLAGQGITATANTPDEFDRIIRGDTARFAELFRDAGVGSK